MSPALQRLRWIAPLAILALAAVLRFWALARPNSLVFDELYYVRDAVSQLANGFPTLWPDNDPAFGGERARAFTDEASTIAHPPLGKWLIGLGILLFGPDSGWGWRFSVALTGVATVGATMRLGFVLTRRHVIAWIAGFMLALDGVHVVMSRVSLLDGFLTLFVVLGAICVAEDWRSTARRPATIVWRRPWLLAAGISFGAATGVKWSGLYPFAAFLVLLTLGDLLRRWGEDRRPMSRTLVQGLVTATLALPAAFATYVLSWLGWILGPEAPGKHEGTPWWVALWNWHVDAFAWHSTLSAPHPYQSHPLSWPFGLTPTAMFHQRWEDHVAVISPLPNPLVTWTGVLALVLLWWVVARAVWRAFRIRSFVPVCTSSVAISVFVLAGYLSGWLPWVLTSSRSAVFQFYAVVLTPFAALAVALVLAAFVLRPERNDVLASAGIFVDSSPSALQSRRIAVAIFLSVTAVVGLFFWPLWIGMPVDEWFYRAHLWLPDWN